MRFILPVITVAFPALCIAELDEYLKQALDKNVDTQVVDESSGTGVDPGDEVNLEGSITYDGNPVKQSPQVEWTSNDEDGIVPLIDQRKPEGDSDTLGKSRAELLAAAFPGVPILRGPLASLKRPTMRSLPIEHLGSTDDRIMPLIYVGPVSQDGSNIAGSAE